MNKILININTSKVVSYNSDVKPFQFAINIQDVNSIEKLITKEIKKHKNNLFGEKLYNITINDKLHEVTEYDVKDKIATPIFDISFKDELVKFVDDPLTFDLSDIIENKKNQLKKQFNFENCLLYEINLQDNIDLNYEFHKADTGYKLIRIHGNGNIKTKVINFSSKIKKVKLIFENSQPIQLQYSFDEQNYFDLNGDTVESTKSFDKISFKINNLSSTHNDITSFALLF